jgi:predicted secreted protein
VEATSVQITYDKYNVYSDNNGDKIINKGETVTIEVYLKNIGTSTAKAVKATFSTASMYVSGFTPTTQVTYGDMVSGNSRYGGTDIRFTVSSSAPAGTQIPINISITDNSGNTWTESFTVVVFDLPTSPIAASTQTWVFGSQTWSDRIVASPSNCTQTDVLSTSDYSATQYKIYGGRYYYTWQCAYNNRASFCPSPWRMPSSTDFDTLFRSADYETLEDAWGLSSFYYDESSHSSFGGTSLWGSEDFNTMTALSFFYNRGIVAVAWATSKYSGLEVRCVK